DTIMTLTAYGKNGEKAVEEAVEEINRLDALLSTGKEDSEISVLNANGSGEVSEDTEILLKRSLEINEQTDGLFDCTIYPLMELWGFPTGEYHVATEEELDALLPYIDAGKIQIDENRVTLGEGQRIDLGAIAKGYTSAKMMDIFKKNGVTSGMVSLGGNVQTLGAKTDGSKWKIGIKDPENPDGQVLMALAIEDKAVITSGGYERFFEEGGKKYIHILDPRTGTPVENDLASVTIISPDGTLADALSTSLFIMGRDQSITFWTTHHQSFEMVLITKSGEILITEGLAPDITCNSTYKILKIQ
ncbi:MAG: FAD:protein FMN transferase, partial [Clostridiales bacterium]|nr:FAD:protein FMN transferase [Candidatus Blautia equi]